MEIESILKILARAAGTGHSNYHNAQGCTSFWMCKVRCWRWLFGNKIPVSLAEPAAEDQAQFLVAYTRHAMRDRKHEIRDMSYEGAGDTRYET